ncbi:hypothetical protein AKJ57_05280 [candidate division MSBL1 archaeon SCGC-AAA259A05]|uniref:Carbohydrate-binding module family 96 domain-containing protein n=1 Tax=candidate division MSBL1 archaeon SCGC-AAA259A05 TaxID=1698259 RepID=A0A133U5N2_9EURY|nr:hypothetical protein AKJ57_05280 [candidate division MSBL1 archaeon SCGC-AAA259A05]
MDFSKLYLGKIKIIMVILILLLGSVSASQYFSVSNMLRDEIDVISDDSRIPLEINYSEGMELGGENKTLKAGNWEEFGIMLTNKSSDAAEPWENVLIRIKFHDVRNEYISVGYKHDGTWENTYVHDLRSIQLGGAGGVVDLGPEGGWTVKPQTTENFELRVKFGKPVQDVGVEIQAITKGQESKEGEGGVKNPYSTDILEPVQDAYIHQANPSASCGSEDHLEVDTKENANVYALIKFDSSTIPEQVEKAELKLYQYWGSGFQDLRSSGVTLQLFPTSVDWNENSLTWKNKPTLKDYLIAEENIKRTKRWYTFDITNYVNSPRKSDDMSLLLKFGKDNFDNRERRIRFTSRCGIKAPYLFIK